MTESLMVINPGPPEIKEQIYKGGEVGTAVILANTGHLVALSIQGKVRYLVLHWWQECKNTIVDRAQACFVLFFYHCSWLILLRVA